MLGSIISAAGGFLAANHAADKQAKLQKEFAQNALTWKAQDAERAGISKYFAMGAPTASYSPVSVGGTDFSNVGNAIDRAMGQGGSGSTTTGKLTGLTTQIAAAQLDGIRIDNDIKRAELASKSSIATQPGAGGVLDRDVSIGPGAIKLKRDLSPASPDHGQRSFGVSPEVDLYRTKKGFAPAPPQNLAEVHENNALMRWQWMARNQLLPYMFDSHRVAPKAFPGYEMTFDPVLGEYVYYKKGGSSRPTSRHEGWEYMMEKLRR